MSETQKPETLVRPVKCYFCNQPMFYSNDGRHEPEIRVTVRRGDPDDPLHFYAHVRCWNAKIG